MQSLPSPRDARPELLCWWLRCHLGNVVQRPHPSCLKQVEVGSDNHHRPQCFYWYRPDREGSVSSAEDMMTIVHSRVRDPLHLNMN